MTSPHDVSEAEVNHPFKRIPHCACDDGSGPSWTRSEFAVRTAECKLRGGPCRDQAKQVPA